MTQKSIPRLRDEPETPRLDSRAASHKPRREILTRAKEALDEASTLGLLVILAGAESVRHRRAPPPSDTEQFREYGDGAD